MTRKTIIGLTAGLISVAAVAGVAINNANTAPKMSDLMLKNLEVLSRDEGEWGCGGNSTFTKNESLKSDPCLNGGTHKKCKRNEGVCCNPSEQTDCGGLVDIGLN